MFVEGDNVCRDLKISIDLKNKQQVVYRRSATFSTSGPRGASRWSSAISDGELVTEWASIEL